MKAYIRASFILFFLSVSIVTINSAFSAENDEQFSLAIPLNEGIQAEAAQDYERAIESYRKVLFVDGMNVRAEYGLAFSLEKSGRTAKAVREYKIFLKLAKDDTVLPKEERDAYVAQANAALKALCQDNKGLACLSFLQINIFLVTGLLTLALLVKLLRAIGSAATTMQGDDKKLADLWKDRNALKNKERELRLFPIDFFTIVMIGLWILLCWVSFNILSGR
jgi:tetratricopeptide (TPR) repeat protein